MADPFLEFETNLRRQNGPSGFRRHPRSAPGPWCVEAGECMLCRAPENVAPDLMASVEEGEESGCYFKKQPSSPRELEQAIAAFDASCVAAVHYHGEEPEVLRILGFLRRASCCLDGRQLLYDLAFQSKSEGASRPHGGLGRIVRFFKKAKKEPRTRAIRVAHTPDADDAFMFHGLISGNVPLPAGLKIEHVVEDIESLNQKAQRDELDVTAVSFHAYAHIHDRYRILSAGASVGDGYGPIIVARPGRTLKQVSEGTIAVPGALTTAILLLKLRFPKVRTKIVRFDQIPEAVARGEAAGGVVIHEGQLTFAKSGLEKLLDLGAWWKEETGLPVPLGTNVIRRDVPDPRLFCRALRDSVSYALAHREEALDSAMKYARGMSREDARRFVGMYVNGFTIDLGENGRHGVRELLGRAYKAGLTSEMPPLDYVEP